VTPEQSRCQLSDYYRTGVDISLARRFLDKVEKEEDFALPGVQLWRLTELRKNLWSLGFLEARDEPRSLTVSSRGYSLVVLWRPLGLRVWKKEVAETLSRFVLLKSISDVDWPCFTTFLADHFLRGMRPDEIHNEMFPDDSKNNFSHRFGFHLSVASKSQISKLLTTKTLDLGKIDPYSNEFQASSFLGIRVAKPCTSSVEEALSVSLRLFGRGILGKSTMSSAEAVKTTVQAVLLSKRYFLPEPDLASLLLDLSLQSGVSIYQNPGYLRQEGRGLYRNDEFFTIISLTRRR
jgi:hypothetical protein